MADILRDMTSAELIMELIDAEEEAMLCSEDPETRDVEQRIAMIKTYLNNKADGIDAIMDTVGTQVAENKGIKKYYSDLAAKANSRINALARTTEYLQVHLLPQIINAVGKDGVLKTEHGTYGFRTSYTKVEVTAELPAKYYIPIPATQKVDGKLLRSDCIQAIKEEMPFPAGAEMRMFKKGVRK
jgi:hypothetical protein